MKIQNRKRKLYHYFNKSFLYLRTKKHQEHLFQSTKNSVNKISLISLRAQNSIILVTV